MLTPARMRFLANSVFGPLAGVMSTLELSSLDEGIFTCVVFPIQ